VPLGVLIAEHSQHTCIHMCVNGWCWPGKVVAYLAAYVLWDDVGPASCCMLHRLMLD
jgi:hypothetical protein